jgi:hypothetical protein
VRTRCLGVVLFLVYMTVDTLTSFFLFSFFFFLPLVHSVSNSFNIYRHTHFAIKFIYFCTTSFFLFFPAAGILTLLHIFLSEGGKALLSMCARGCGPFHSGRLRLLVNRMLLVGVCVCCFCGRYNAPGGVLLYKRKKGLPHLLCANTQEETSFFFFFYLSIHLISIHFFSLSLSPSCRMFQAKKEKGPPSLGRCV